MPFGFWWAMPLWQSMQVSLSRCASSCCFFARCFCTSVFMPSKVWQLRHSRESVAFIPIITADYQQGAWATEELQSAITKRIETDFKIIPILLENCERPELIRHLRYVDFAAHDPETFESKVGELIDAIYGLTLNPFRA